MNETIKLIKQIYGTIEYDWMCEKIDNDEELTLHHINKKCKGGEDNINNYALLLNKSHQLLNYLEFHDSNMYLEINNMFKELNNSNSNVTKEYYIKMKELVKKSRKKIKNAKRNRKQ